MALFSMSLQPMSFIGPWRIRAGYETTGLPPWMTWVLWGGLVAVPPGARPNYESCHRDTSHQRTPRS